MAESIGRFLMSLNPYILLIVTAIVSVIFGYYASRNKVNILEVLLYSVGMVAIAIVIGMGFVGIEPVHTGRESGSFWGLFGLSIGLLINGFVLLIMFLLYSKKNPTQYLKNNKIVFHTSSIFGGIFSFISFGFLFLGCAAFALVQDLFPIKGLIALVLLIPLILGFYLMGKSRQWVFRLMIYVIRKNLPENIQRNLVIEKGKIEFEEEEE